MLLWSYCEPRVEPCVPCEWCVDIVRSPSLWPIRDGRNVQSYRASIRHYNSVLSRPPMAKYRAPQVRNVAMMSIVLSTTQPKESGHNSLLNNASPRSRWQVEVWFGCDGSMTCYTHEIDLWEPPRQFSPSAPSR